MGVVILFCFKNKKALSESENALSKLETALCESENARNKLETTLSELETALSESETDSLEIKPGKELEENAIEIKNIIEGKDISTRMRLKLLGYQQSDPSMAYKRNICIKTYEPGTFTLAEISPNAQFMKKPKMFSDWLKDVLQDEIPLLQEKLGINNIAELKRNINTVLESKTSYGRALKQDIWYQEYSDIIRRIIFLILKSDPDYKIELYPNLTSKRKGVAFHVIESIKQYKNPTRVEEWLKLSIAAGLMGVDEKSMNLATSEINSKNSIPLDNSNESYEACIRRISNTLWDFAFTKTKIDASQWFFNFCELGEGIPFKLVSFSDDYIETIFLLQYYQELLETHPDIEIDLVPRSLRCGNDATYDDVIDFLDSFPKLKSFHPRRFRVHENGPKLSTVNLLKLHPSIMSLIDQSDLVEARGARNYEMMQGIKKDICFGFMVCREFSESVTGLKSEDIPLIYIKQTSGEKSFSGFRKRHERQENGVMLCEKTANDNKIKFQGGHLSTYESWNKAKKTAYKINQSFYRNNADYFHKKHGEVLEQNVMDCLDKFRGKILVAGCGSGKEVRYLQQRACQPCGIDFSFEAIRLARLLNPELWYRFSVEDLYNIEFYEENSYDGVVFNASLLHLPQRDDLSSILKHTKKILKPGGLCFIRVLEKKGLQQELCQTQRWFVYYTLNKLHTCCKKLGFKIKKKKTE